MACTTAIIAVAGHGTRMLPITKAIEKCMLPIGTRPVVDYAVQDCIKAGIRHIVFVVSPHTAQLRAYYSDNVDLNTYLVRQNKQAFLEACQPPNDVHFEYVEQDVDVRYGTAIPVDIALHSIPKGESVLVWGGDDFVWHKPDEPGTAASLIHAANDGEAAMLGVPVERDLLSRYGVLQFDHQNMFQSIVEKPRIDEAPSNLINVSKYLMPPSLVDEIASYCQNKRTGEYFITDPINTWIASGGRMHVVDNGGVYLDAGNPDSWLKANTFISQQAT